VERSQRLNKSIGLAGSAYPNFHVLSNPKNFLNCELWDHQQGSFRRKFAAIMSAILFAIDQRRKGDEIMMKESRASLAPFEPSSQSFLHPEKSL